MHHFFYYYFEVIISLHPYTKNETCWLDLNVSAAVLADIHDGRSHHRIYEERFFSIFAGLLISRQIKITLALFFYSHMRSKSIAAKLSSVSPVSPDEMQLSKSLQQEAENRLNHQYSYLLSDGSSITVPLILLKHGASLRGHPFIVTRGSSESGRITECNQPVFFPSGNLVFDQKLYLLFL